MPDTAETPLHAGRKNMTAVEQSAQLIKIMEENNERPMPKAQKG
jgi:hypothetical protein